MEKLRAEMSYPAQFEEIERQAAGILKKYGYPHTLPDVLALTMDDRRLPEAVTFAAVIIENCAVLRALVKDDNDQKIAVYSLAIGTCHMSLLSEQAVSGRENKRTTRGTETRSNAKAMRQAHMKAIATDKGWKPGKELSKTELRTVYTLLRDRHPQYSREPDDDTLSRDALAIGLRKKR